MECIGKVVLLQVQRSSLKVGERGARSYDPSPLAVMHALEVDPGGVVGWDGAGRKIVDVHHRDHPASKFAGDNAISVGFTAHYGEMRDHFGRHLTDGIAGENILVETDRMMEQLDLDEGLIILTSEGQEVRLQNVRVAEPCVEFSRYALQFDPRTTGDRRVTEAVQFLRAGMRGFYAGYSGETAQIRQGDSVFL